MPYSRTASRLRLLPLMLPMGLLFGAGALVTVLQSFGLLSAVPGSDGGAGAWKIVFSDRWLWRSILYTAIVAVTSALVSIAIGSVLAWWIHGLSSRGRSLSQVYRIPLILPHLTVAYLTILVFGQSGFISSVAARLGLVSEPRGFPNFLYGGFGIGIILAYVMKETSFVVLMTLGQLRKLDSDLIHSARMLGAGGIPIFRDIVLPHIRPVLVSSFLILSLYAFGAFEIPWLIGETKPQMLSVTIYNLYFQRDLAQRPVAAAVLSLMMLLSAVAILVALRISRRRSDHA